MVLSDGMVYILKIEIFFFFNLPKLSCGFDIGICVSMPSHIKHLTKTHLDLKYETGDVNFLCFKTKSWQPMELYNVRKLLNLLLEII